MEQGSAPLREQICGGPQANFGIVCFLSAWISQWPTTSNFLNFAILYNCQSGWGIADLTFPSVGDLSSIEGPVFPHSGSSWPLQPGHWPEHVEVNVARACGGHRHEKTAPVCCCASKRTDILPKSGNTATEGQRFGVGLRRKDHPDFAIAGVQVHFTFQLQGCKCLSRGEPRRDAITTSGCQLLLTQVTRENTHYKYHSQRIESLVRTGT